MGKREFYLEILKKLENQEDVLTETVLEGKQAGEKSFLKTPAQSRKDSYVENLYGKPHAVLCGGGHVSLALAKVLELMDFRITVVDDRAEFANRERFPRAAVYCQDFASCLEEKEFGPNTYYIIVTRGHQADYTCLKRILRKPSAYVGMIGSGRKVALAFQRLRADGFSEEEMKRVHAPVGLSIGAQTPAEIAVSIAAEIIQEKNRYQRNILEEAVAEGIRSPQGRVLVSVIEKHGSSPRGTGTRMVVSEDGSIYGTIGGGSVEFAAAERAERLTEEFALEEYDLGNSQAAGLGMVCGGRVKVMFELL